MIVGIYGVVSYSVSQCTQEIGVRLAPGAQRPAIFALIVGQAMRPALVGMTIGALVALASTRLITGLLFGVSAIDPITFTGAAVGLIFVALLACYIPARRAATVDPMVALRYE